jgi:putative AbiEii toxin of type IV toxin-antitoxin system
MKPMHIKHVTAKSFRRFTDLEITNIPATTRQVVLAGPNGNGKSSLFDGFLRYQDRFIGRSGWEPQYHGKRIGDVEAALDQIEVEFYEQEPNDKLKLFYMRSAYRNEAMFSGSTIQPMPAMLQERRFRRMIENDATVHGNYQRLYAQGMEDAYENEKGTVTLQEFREKTIGEIRDLLKKVLPEIELLSLGNPFKVESFRFTKGAAQKFNYMNLSGGEKAAFDLVLDYTLKRKEFDDTVFCVDEPEAHLNPRVHAPMLDVLLSLTQPKSQLWIATHAIGMLRRARDLYFEKPGEIVFLDFEKDFDLTQVLRPLVPDRAFWRRSLQVALHDIAELVAPERIIACESAKKDGAPGAGFDSEVYNIIFGQEFPETKFVSIGSSTDIKGDRYLVVQAVANLIEGTRTVRLIDRDGMSEQEVKDHEKGGYRVLRRRQIESYLLDDEILVALCASAGGATLISQVLKAKAHAVAEAVKNGHDPDDIKKARGRIAEAVKKILSLKNAGKSSAAFMRDTLAPLVTPDTKVYKDLKAAIFG